MTTKIHKSHLALLKLIEKNGNNSCADCGSLGTRWASWNLGIFLCIRCAGIHRNLGVHISKVKSVDLDSWTSEQLESMETMGNKKSQNIYEAALPEFFMRPQTNYAVEEFIRAKYQYKRYCIATDSPPNLTTDNTAEIMTSNTPKKSEEPQKNLVNFEVCKDKESLHGSDDSLSDPEYLVQQKQSRNACHKVHSDGDLISFNSTSNASNNQDLMSLDHKNNIMSLYSTNVSVSHGYQSSGHDVGSTHHRSYGSSSDTAYHSTTNIPASGQSNYLRQIQDKLTNIKVNLTSKFRQYEQPNGNTSFQSQLSSGSNHSFSSTTARGNIKPDAGQTLSPDLWR